MDVQDVRFGNIIQNNTTGACYKITGGESTNGKKLVALEEITEEEYLALQYILDNFSIVQEWKWGKQIF